MTGAALLVRFYLRLDRVKLPIWVLSVAGLVLVSATSVASLYGSPEEVAGYVALVELSRNMATVNRAMNGPGFGFADPNPGVVLVNEVAIWGALAFALMAVFQTARLTRGEEESRRTEVLRARRVGRHAPLAAASVVVAGSQVLTGVVVLTGFLLNGYAVAGSVALVLGYLASGLVFAAVTAVAAQVLATARATVGAGVAAVGTAFLIRAVGDVGDGTLSWLSPIGWVHRVRPFAGERWWVLLLSVAVVVLAFGAAIVVADRRNFGGGLVQPRPGPLHAGALSSRYWGLVLRLQAGSIIAWSTGLLVLGVAYGSVAGDVEQMFADEPDLQRFLPSGSSPTDSFLSYTLAMGAMLAAGAALAAVLRLRAEERAGRLEFLLARPMPRVTCAAVHVGAALGAAAVVLVASGIGTGLGVGASGGTGRVLELVGASLGLWPMVMVLVGLAMLAIGAAPRWSALSWAGLALVVVVGLFAELLRLPQAVRQASPLAHLAAMPADPFDPSGFGLVVAAGVSLVSLGVFAFTRRDVPVA